MRQVICCTDESFEFGGVASSAAAGGHEGAHADVDAEAALDDGGYGSGDGNFFGEGALQGGPVAGLRDAEARELVVALLVAAGDGDGERVAGLDGFGIVRKGRARQNAFGLVADVEEDLIGGRARPPCPLTAWSRRDACGSARRPRARRRKDWPSRSLSSADGLAAESLRASLLHADSTDGRFTVFWSSIGFGAGLPSAFMDLRGSQARSRNLWSIVARTDWFRRRSAMELLRDSEVR